MANYSYSQLEQLWISSGGPSAVAPLMAAIAMAESGGNPNAVNNNTNGSTDRGLWQINSSNVNSTSMFDPSANAKEAISIYHSQGLTAWTTYTSGAYKQFYNSSTAPSSLPQGGDTGASLTSSAGGLIGFPVEITSFFSDANTLITALAWLVQPSSWVRIGAFLAGVVLLLLALHAFLAVGEGGNLLLSAPKVLPVPV